MFDSDDIILEYMLKIPILKNDLITGEDSYNLTEKEYRFMMEMWTAETFDIHHKMYEFKIVKIDGKTAVYLKLHHIICDAWGVLLTGEKIVDYYYKTAYLLKIPKEEVPQYEQYIQKEQDYLASKRYEKDEAFWKAKYEKKPSFVTLSPNQKSDHDVKAKRNSYVISEKETEAIHQYCEKNNISSAILLEAVTALYAARINNANDVTLCSLVINRSGADEKNTIGMYNNILPLTIAMNYEETFEELCQKVLAEHYEVYRHQKYPLANILNIIREKHGKDVELYDIMVSYQNGQFSEEVSEKAEAQWIFNGTSDLGFMLNISDRNNDGRITFDFDYRLNCFTEEEIDHIYHRFIHMVNQVIVSPDLKCKDVEIVTFEEKEQILVDFNNTLKPYPNDKCLNEYIEENAKKNPQKVALRFEGAEMTYQEFNEKANCLAHYITQQEKRRNAIIGVMTERSFEMLIAIYAIIKSGNVYMPMDVNFPTDRIHFMLQDSNAQLVLTQNKFVNRFDNALKVVDLNTFDYEKYDKTNDTHILCPFCSRVNPVSDDVCKCGAPLVK